MQPSDFVHLHVHSEYSLLDGLANIGELARKVSALGQTAIALTDHGNLSGVVQFHDACRRNNIRPIIGCEVYCSINDTVDQDRDEKQQGNYHLTLLATSMLGYRNLNEIISQANKFGFHRKPKVWRALLVQYSEGIICLSGCLGGEVQQLLRKGKFNEAYLRAAWFKSVFGDRYFFEVHDHGIPEQKQVIESIMEFSKLLGVPIVAANDSHYIEKNDAPQHELLLAIQTKALWSDPGRWSFPGDKSQYYVKSTQEMELVFPGHPEWLLQSRAIAEQCDVRLETIRQEFPVPVNVLPGQDEFQSLYNMSLKGLSEKGYEYDDAVIERLDHELETIRSTGYVRYFMIVADVCQWAKSQGIRTSARGSVAGSLVAYALGIAPVDPMRYGLSFERFLNPGRTPDIDLDFADDRRAEVFRYVSSAYGEENVAGIITFSQMQGRSAVRDVGRVFSVPGGVINDVITAIPIGATLKKTIATNRTLRERVETTPWLQSALRLEGTVRHSSVHAAGVVIAGSPLVNRVSLVRNPGGDLPVVGVEMGDAEKLGLVKFDFLGLKTLSLVDRTVALVEESTGVRLDVDNLPDGDPDAYRVLGDGDTVGVFQLEGPGMRKYLIDLQPSTIDHLQAMVALYRPGPLAEIPKYIRRRHGQEKVSYPHPIFEPILRDTYGVFVYQESIMEMAQQIAGMTPYESDKFLYAIRKKHPETLAHYEPLFRDACLSKGVDIATFHSVWASLLPFGDYGFNKAHAACYGYLAYVTAWLKGKYPAHFYAALLSTESSDKARTSLVLGDARRRGVRILSPCVNRSGVSFTVEGDAVRFGLGSISGVGRTIADRIIQARGEGGYTSVYDFRWKVPKKSLNDKGYRALIVSQSLQYLENAYDILTGIGDTKAYSEADMLDMERDALGVVVSNPNATLSRLDNAGRTHLIGEVLQRFEDGMEGESVCVGGIIIDTKKMPTKSGKMMCHVMLEDETGSIRGVAFSEVASRDAALLKAGAMVIMTADVQSYLESASLLIRRVIGVNPSPPVDKR
ncbi:MAG: DNA polymerase III subunit alpha [Proteobacteria bacterium]|nr:DNA polymerase III subunit alpha [Pseudomonadota bacterium]